MQTVLIAGATGYLGRYLVKAMKERGYRVRALARNPESLAQPGPHGSPSVRSYTDEVFKGEATKPSTLEGACDGVDAVISAIGITRQKDGATYMDVDYEGNLNVLREAEASERTDRFMYISVFKGGEIPGSLTAAKERFVRRLKQSELGHVVVRPTGYFSDMEDFLQMARKGRVYLFGTGDRKMNPIHGADLAAFCAEGLAAGNAELPVGGPQMLTHRQIAGLAFRAAGKPERIAAVPAWLIRPVIPVMKRLSPGNAGAFEFVYHVMTRDMAAPCYGSRDLAAYFKQAASAE
ncbi:SDR family oxidoreductase [Paenibacillus humicola]|uniref:SDR family oxidoreductase n=1 Tax=Paenibacillus humicola TaxID=3110540 RepID=UPI00237BF7B5|nr:SDR family oxidoreductase [Paenibacillus humicola]